MGSRYCKLDIEEVKNDFILEQENIIKVLLCNARLEEIVSGMKDVLKNFKDDFGDVSAEYSDVINVSNEELCNFIEKKSLTKSELNRTYVELYELFERNLKLILEYIHYQKTEIVFNKSKQIDGNIVNEIIKDPSSIEQIIKKYIDENVNKIIYGKSIEYTINFICKKSKVEINKDTKEKLVGLSTIRNCIVHNKGIVTRKDFNKAKLLFEDGFEEKFEETFEADVTHYTIKWSSSIYKDTITAICNALKN